MPRHPEFPRWFRDIFDFRRRTKTPPANQATSKVPGGNPKSNLFSPPWRWGEFNTQKKKISLNPNSLQVREPGINKSISLTVFLSFFAHLSPPKQTTTNLCPRGSVWTWLFITINVVRLSPRLFATCHSDNNTPLTVCITIPSWQRQRPRLTPTIVYRWVTGLYVKHFFIILFPYLSNELVLFHCCTGKSSPPPRGNGDESTSALTVWKWKGGQ